MNGIIIGGGSIGKRHSNNLNSLGVNTRIVDVDEIDNIETILDNGYDFGMVCSPNINHIEHCNILVDREIPIFCEKPFYSDSFGIEDLLTKIQKRGIISMVGCNLRFTPEVDNIDETAKYISVYFGYNLKKWRPGTNHLLSYSSNRNLGGGVLLDAIHELDYLYYKFGEIQSIQKEKLKLTNITNDTEDFVTGKIIFKSGTIAHFTLNYLSNEYHRYYDVLIGDRLIRTHFNIDNKMYIREIEYFLECVRQNKQPMNNFLEASNLLEHIIPYYKHSVHRV